MHETTDKPRVALARCPDYGPAVQEAVQRAVAGLGGMARLIRPGWKVLIKPNLVSAKEPDRAITTHPEVVRAVIRLVREAGATPSVGADSEARASIP